MREGVAPANRRFQWLAPVSVVAGIGALVVQRATLAAHRLPTGSDESLYLMQALDWLGRFRKLAPDYHRTRGVSALLYPITAVSENVSVQRFALALLGVALVAVTYLIGRRFLGRGIAALAALAFGLWHLNVNYSTKLLPDVPGALCVALAWLFYWDGAISRRRDDPLGRLWPAGLALGGAFYFNIAYAALGGVAMAADLLLHRPKGLLSRRTLEAAAALGVCVGPYFARSWMDHGDPLFSLRVGLRGSSQLGGAISGGNPGYVDYTHWFFELRMFGPFLGAAVIAGVAVLLASLVRSWPIPRRQASALALWLVIPTVGMALLFHAEERYLLPVYPAAFLTAALTARAFASRVSPSVARVAGVALLAPLGVFASQQYAQASNSIDGLGRELRLVHAAAQRLDAIAPASCKVYVRYPREFMLETGCDTTRYGTLTHERLLARAAEDDAAFFVIFDGLRGDSRQPDFLYGFLARNAALAFAIDAPGSMLRRAEIYRFAPTEVPPG